MRINIIIITLYFYISYFYISLFIVSNGSEVDKEMLGMRH